MKLNNINPDVPAVKTPEYKGEYYEVFVPATLDIAERAGYAVNALTETLDPEFDYELYWLVDLLAKKPVMFHNYIDDLIQAKFFQALPLVRTASGSKQNIDIERFQMENYLKMQGDDGLIYFPIKGRPWALPAKTSPFSGLDYIPSGDYLCFLGMAGRILGAFCIYALKDPGGPWMNAANRLLDGIRKVTIFEDDIAYPFLLCTEPGKPVVKPEKRPVGFRAAFNGWLAQGLVQCYRSIGNKVALEIGEKMMRYIMRDSGYFTESGSFGEEMPLGDESNFIQFHTHTTQIMAALEVVQAGGDKYLLDRALKAYNYAVSQGESKIGFFPEFLKYNGNAFNAFGVGLCSSEICEVADMIASAIKLSLLGIDKWDDVDRWTRNQFAEGQLVNTGWLTDGHMEPIDREKAPLITDSTPECITTDRVLERVIGSFAGWSSANDFVQGKNWWTIMHCCTGNATRAIYYVWENIIDCKDGKLRINLLMNRASKWADINSHIPYSGRVDIKIKQDVDLEVRIAEWVKPEEAVCMVNGNKCEITFDGRYACVGSVHKDDEVVLEFPINETTEEVVIEKHVYTITRRGNDIVAINPQGKNCPLYQRGHYRNGETLWKKSVRFVPEQEIKWC
ncbi:MAG: glycoside hydrolase family 127 protein [Clostridiales bacterium]|nr:glycoside hydrolase family 127 protein [Clostridiales bacterium]